MIEYLELHSTLFLFSCIIIGLIIGSFINVIIYRLPIILNRQWTEECNEFLKIKTKADTKEKPLNLLYPRSKCVKCNKQLLAKHNIPIISYIVLRGKCAFCKNKISLRYPIIEALTALFFLLNGIYFGPSIEFAASCVLFSSLIALSTIDLDHHILPDQITIPLIWLGLILSIYSLFADAHEAIIGAAFGYLSLWGFAKIYEKITGKFAMGHGDFKLLAVAGAWLGWQQLPFIIIASSLIGFIAGIILMLLNKKDFDTPIPYGPYLALATGAAIFFGDEIIIIYFDWFRIPY